MAGAINPAVSRETAKWTTQTDQDIASLKKDLALLQQQYTNLTAAQSGTANALGKQAFKTEPAVFAAADFGEDLVNGAYSNPVLYTNAAIEIPRGYTNALITLTGTVSATNQGVGSDTIQLVANSFYNIRADGDTAGNTTLDYIGLCSVPQNSSGTAVSATYADVSVVGPGSGDKLYVGILSYFSGPTNGTLTSAECRIVGSVTFYRES